MKKTLLLNGIKIEYELERKRVKNLNLRVRPDGTVHISVPYFTPQSTVERFLASNAAAVLAALEKQRMRAQRAAHGKDEIFIGGELLPIRCVTGAKNEAALCPGYVLLTLRCDADSSARDKALKKFIRLEAERAVRESCTRIYPIFRAIGVGEPELKFRAMKSRWGSCRWEKCSLSFNTALAHTPTACVEYVVMHEFCHFIHHDHSPAFHQLMTKLMPDWKKRKHLLENYSALL